MLSVQQETMNWEKELTKFSDMACMFDKSYSIPRKASTELWLCFTDVMSRTGSTYFLEMDHTNINKKQLKIEYIFLILSYLFTDAPSIQKIIASYAYLWFVFSPEFLLEI